MCALLRLGIRFVAFVVALLASAVSLSFARPLAAQDVPQDAPAVRPASFLSRSPLVFDALLADPRWPHFSAAYQGWHGSEFDGVGAVSFGESFPFHRWRLDGDVNLDFGIQAGVFAIFDLEADSRDLLNADYLVGPVLAARSGAASALLRFTHESSHLGDEYLLRDDAVERINLSFERVDLIASWHATDHCRLYVGAGGIVHSKTDLDRWTVQGGVEYLAGTTWLGGRPVVAVDVQSREYTAWELDVSVRAGLQFRDEAMPGGRVQLLVEYYTGSSPHGQFYVDDIELVGIGLHFYF